MKPTAATCLRIKITVVVKVFSIIYPVSSINHFVHLAFTKILLHLLPLGLSVDKDAQHIRCSPLHKTKDMDNSLLNLHELSKVPMKILCW